MSLPDVITSRHAPPAGAIDGRPMRQRLSSCGRTARNPAELIRYG